MASLSHVSQELSQQGDDMALAPLSIIRTETVLSRLPIHNLAKRGTVNIHIVKHNARGRVELYWKVTPNPAFGAPRQLAYKLDTLVINRRFDEIGRPLPVLVYLGSLRDIARELSLGNNTLKVKNALRQNAHTVIGAKLRYTDHTGVEQEVEFENTRYGVIFTGETLPDGCKADGVYLMLNPPYRQVLNSAPVRPLDYTYLKSLSPSAQRFYEIVSYKIFAAIKYRQPHARLSYAEYCTFSAQERYSDYDHVKKQMYKVHRPHRQSGYIADVWYDTVTGSDGLPDWIMHYTPGPRAKAAYKKFAGEHGQIHDQLLLAEKEPDPTPADQAEAQALELVTLFYSLFHHIKKPIPSGKELAEAAALIKAHGADRSRFIVEFSHRTATEINYQPQTFLGICHYTTRALAAYDDAHTHSEAKAAIAACTLCDPRGYITFEDQTGKSFVAHCPHDPVRVAEWQTREGLTLIRLTGR
jgi:hypothetical protein